MKINRREFCKLSTCAIAALCTTPFYTECSNNKSPTKPKNSEINDWVFYSENAALRN